MQNAGKCPICGSEAFFSPERGGTVAFYECPLCGRFELSAYDKFNYNHLASYLLYHSFNHRNGIEYRYHTGLEKETCDKYRREFEQGNLQRGRPVHMDAEIIENWYPKTFSERVDKILLYIDDHTPHIGQEISFSSAEMLGVLFIDRHKMRNDLNYSDCTNLKWRDENDCEREAEYMLDYLVKCGYVNYVIGPSMVEAVILNLTPDGYARVETLQKQTSHGRNVLVAMKFGDETIRLREAIRQGITNAGYVAIFIDEVQHNDFITPELLKYIRDSKFVVVDLTHKNNGAYFEAGYAMGLGKPVIQLCKHGIELHFDVAQKNTIKWEVETDIPERLFNRIKATID